MHDDMASLISKKPETYLQLLRRSGRLYADTFFKVLLLAFLLSIVTFIPRLISVMVGQDLFLNLPLVSLRRLWLLLVDIVSLFFFIAILWRLYCHEYARDEPIGEDMATSLQKTPRVIVAALIQFGFLLLVALTVWGISLLITHTPLGPTLNYENLAVISIMFILQTLFVFYIYILLYFYAPLIANENNGIIASLKRSATLVWGNWWRTFLLQITPWFCYFLLLILIRFLIGIDIHIYYMSNMLETFAATILNIILFAFFIPWVAAVMVVQLRDLELRKKAAS